MATSTERAPLRTPQLTHYGDGPDWPVKNIPSGHGGTIEVADPSQLYLYDIATSLREIAALLRDSKREKGQ